MGFGIALLGYAFLLLNEFGGATFAALLLCYGFFLAARLNKTFIGASAAALFLLPRGVLQLCVVFGIVDPEVHPLLNGITYIIHLAAWGIMTYYWMSAVIAIAHECNAPKLLKSARNRMVITVVFIMFSIFAGFMSMSGALDAIGATVTSLQFILQYVVIIINILFLHTCFVLITSEKQYEKDKIQLSKERAEAIDKMQKKRQEAAAKLAEKNAKKKK